LVEFVMSLPSDYKIGDATTKRILRDSMAGILPERVRLRMDKTPFFSEEKQWITLEKPELFKDLVRETLERCKSIIDEKKIAQRLNGMIDGELPYDPLLLRIVCFGAWVKRFNVDVE
jgi:asparagine synthase (glutamine-hydrolysing)